MILDRDRVNLAMAPPDPQLLCELRRTSQTSRFTRARQLTSTVLPGRRPDGYADQVTGRLRRIAAARSTGMLGVCLVDWDSGMPLGTLGGGKYLDLDLAAAGNTEVIRAKMRTLQSLRLNDTIEDILITLGKQYHLIRLLTNADGAHNLFLYLVLDRSKANLALARHQLKRIEAELIV